MAPMRKRAPRREGPAYLAPPPVGPLRFDPALYTSGELMRMRASRQDGNPHDSPDRRSGTAGLPRRRGCVDERSRAGTG